MEHDELQAVINQYQQWLANSQLQEAILTAKVQKLTSEVDQLKASAEG